MNLSSKRRYADDLPYWKTSKSTVDSWLNKAKREIATIGGKITGEAYLNDADKGRAAFMLSFTLEGRLYVAKWAVMPTKRGTEQDQQSAKVQAATALYHDIKARVVTCKFQEKHFAFLNYMMLPNGQNVAEAADSTPVDHLPLLLQPPRAE
jgi:hypothetical protein